MTLALDKDNMMAQVVPRDGHSMSRKSISKSALKVLYRLNKSGYAAHLVGGSVRDILLGKHPKDFDVVTDATPEQVRKLFSNSMIIGRRFRLVHVRYGHDIVEVATFRGEHTENSGLLHEDTGMILRDNVYGALEDDVVRRDFTVNALYYNIDDFSVVDYVDGMQDLESRIIRVMGDPKTRYTEDPVRMLRAIRLAAKLQFTIEPATGSAITQLRELVTNVSSARLFDELTKMSLCGHVERTYDLLEEYRLFEQLFPSVHNALRFDESKQARLFLRTALHETDVRIASGKTINPAFLMAVIFWIPMQTEVNRLMQLDEKLYPAMAKAESHVLAQLQPLAIPRRLVAIIRDIWRMQYYLLQTRRNRIYRSFYHPRFRAAYDFLLIRNKAGESLDELCDFWTEFQESNQDDQERLIMHHQKARPGAPRKKSNKRKPKRQHDE